MRTPGYQQVDLDAIASEMGDNEVSLNLRDDALKSSSVPLLFSVALHYDSVIKIGSKSNIYISDFETYLFWF